MVGKEQSVNQKCHDTSLSPNLLIISCVDFHFHFLKNNNLLKSSGIKLLILFELLLAS